jgi:EpsI family protein
MITRSIVLCIAMAASALATSVLTPKLLYSQAHYPGYLLEQSIPKSFGEWALDNSSAKTIISPSLKEELDKFYSETVNRTYINRSGDRVMLSFAYGGDQGRALQVHKPEVCYQAQGFKIIYDAKDTINTTLGRIPVRRLVATQGERIEPITYWIRSGNAIVTGWYEQNKVRLTASLVDGEIADGLLVRISTIGADKDRAYQVHDAFMSALLAHTKELDHDMLLGAKAQRQLQ